MKIEPHQKWSSRKPPTTGPSATPRPAVAAQMPMAIARSRASVKTLISSESVAGMMNAAPAPMTARAAIEPVDAARVRGRRRGDAEHREPGEQRAPAPVAIAERAGQQQQPGEHERVGVDHPLQLADVRVEVAHQRRQRDVDDRVVDDDGEQAHAQHAERRASAARAGHDVTAAGSRPARGRAALVDQDHDAEGDQPHAPEDVAEEVRGVDHRQAERREHADERRAPRTPRRAPGTSGRRSAARARR